MTGDQPMMALKEFEGIQIISLRDFLQNTEP